MYILLLALSNLGTEALTYYRPGVLEQSYVEAGATQEDELGLAVFDILQTNNSNTLDPVILLHGTPGAASNFEKLGPALHEVDGRRVIWFDMPGFGSLANPRMGIPEGRSAKDYADFVFGVLNRLHIERAHIVGWSNGGAVALNMANDHPERIASITLLASVGAQETEGSGSHFFEHAKYKLGDLVLNKLDILIPHFGLLGHIGMTAWCGLTEIGQLKAGETLVVSAKLNPTDRGYVTEGQPAVVKVSTYDFVRYGGLDGHVVLVAPDSSADSEGRPFYRVIVETDRTYLGDAEGKLPILPGMQATVDIHTGDKSVLEYLIKPVLKLRHEAFRER